jgi:multiple sugar transport system ATP-binding protein
VAAAAPDAKLVFDRVSKTFRANGPAVTALREFSLSVASGRFVAILGPSGCGKTTLLRSIGGLETVTSGRILIGDRDVTGAPPAQRDLAMVFQNYALYPHMTVRQNLGYALRVRKEKKKEIARRVDEIAKMLGLQDLLDRRPRELSGGQMQRVAMGRAIVREPAAFLMDEPLSNLDAKLRVQMRAEIAGLQRDLGVTTLYVTHDQVEAMTLGDRVAVMKDGVLQQVGPPLDLYDRPQNVFVASFIGSPQMNLIDGVARGDVIDVGGHSLPAKAPAPGPVVVGVRPEDWRLSDDADALTVTVTVVEELGSDSFVHGTCDVAGTPRTVIVRAPARGRTAKGDQVRVTTDPERVHLFDPGTGVRLG